MGLWGSTMKLPDEEIHAISEDTGCKYWKLSSLEICTDSTYDVKTNPNQKNMNWKFEKYRICLGS